MKQQLYFDRHSGLLTTAVVEDGKLLDLSIENENRQDIVGNIYKGKVVNVLPGMNAAFVDCGLERNCYLSLGKREALADVSRYDALGGKDLDETPTLREGDEIVVQVLKNPRDKKGAKVSTRLSFVGKNLIYLPDMDFLGISRKIKDPELKENLLFTVDGMRNRTEGVVIRTAAPYATRAKIQAEGECMKRLSDKVKRDARTAATGTLLYRAESLPIRILRDRFNDDIESITIGNEDLYDELSALLNLLPEYASYRVSLYKGGRDMFSEAGIFSQIEALSDNVVELENGGNLVIEKTEALTVVDVNTKRFVGCENLEDTVYATNIAAAREIARQVRLRDVSGIVVVDFIDMQDERHKKSVAQELEQSLSHDRVRCRVLPMSELCLVEFTRKRTSNDVSSNLLRPCPHCHGSGYVFSAEFILCRLRAEILEYIARGEETLIVELNEGQMNFLLARDMLKNDLCSYGKKPTGTRIWLCPHRTWHEERFCVRAPEEGRGVLPPDAVLLQI